MSQTKTWISANGTQGSDPNRVCATDYPASIARIYGINTGGCVAANNPSSGVFENISAVCKTGTNSSSVNANGGCNCSSGKTWNAAQGMCVAPDRCDRPSIPGNYSYSGSKSSTGSSTSCFDGCLVYPDSGQCSSNSQGVVRCFGTGMNFIPGSSCTPGLPSTPGQPVPPVVDAAQPSPPPSSGASGSGDSGQSPGTCQSGWHLQQIGTTNPLQVCVPDNNPPKICATGLCAEHIGSMDVCLPCPADNTTGSKTEHKSDGSTTTTTTETSKTPNGVTTTTTTKNCDAAGNCTTKTEDKKQDQPTFCAENPNLSICKDGNFSGDCGAPPACTGDAVQCAIATQVLMDRCAEKKRFDDLDGKGYTNLGQQLLDGHDPNAGNFPTPMNGQQFNINNGLNSDSWLPGGSCISDRFISVMGRSVVLPISKVCEHILPLRYAIMAIAAIVSFYILAGLRTKGD